MKVRNSDMEKGSVHNTASDGDIEIVNYESCSRVFIRFIESGLESMEEASNIRLGKVKLAYHRRRKLHGVGYISGSGNIDKSKGETELIYGRWSSMLARCYASKSAAYRYYGAVGVVVCDEWHDFRVYSKWVNDNLPAEGADYVIDKDKLSKKNKIYSPETCCFISRKENSSMAGVAKGENAKYKLNDPNGMNVEFNNLARFCRENSLSESPMQRVARGERMCHKGWTAAK